MSAVVIILILVALMVAVVASIPLKEYVDDDNDLVIKLLLTKHVFPLDEVELIQIQSDDLKGLMRMFGASVGGTMCGHFFNSRLGNVRIYTRSLKKVVFFEFRGSKYIVNDWRVANASRGASSDGGTSSDGGASSDGGTSSDGGASSDVRARSGGCGKRGAGQVEAVDMPSGRTGEAWAWIVGAAVVVIVAVVCIGTLPSKTYVDSQNDVHFGELWFKHYKVPVDSMEFMPLPEHAFDGGMKINGNAIGTKRSGKFSSDSLGNYRIYADRKFKFVLFTYHGEKFIVNDWR